jgi:membrane protease YdiL (CAAX protease family)
MKDEQTELSDLLRNHPPANIPLKRFDGQRADAARGRHHKAAETRRALAGFSFSMALGAGLAGLLLHLGLVPWPFRGADTVFGTWGRIPVYAPVLLYALASLFWLRHADLPIREWFAWKRVTPLFIAGLGVSIAYSLYLFYTSPFPLKSAGFAPPALVMGLMNAVSEEIIFRLIFMQLLAIAFGSRPRANLIQAAVYALPHLMIGGPLFFLLAAGYGLLLGRITLAAGSIFPAVICHFIIDIGAIGLPLLIAVG